MRSSGRRSRLFCSALAGGGIGLFGLCVALASAGCGGGSPAPYTAAFREFAVPVAGNSPADPKPGCWPDDLRSDVLGNLWFAQHHSNEIGQMSPEGVYTGYPVPTPNSVMDSLVVDAARRVVWVTA